MATVRDLISDALKNITVLGAGQNMTAEDATDALNSLNRMVSSWSADGTVIYSRSTDTKVLSGGVNTYTMGTGGDINTARPAMITDATITMDNITKPLNIWAQNVQATIQLQNFSSPWPSQLYVNNGFPLLTLTLYPIPSGSSTLTLYSLKPLTSFGLNDVLSLPPGYEEALISNLSVSIAPMYEREASKSVKDSAYDSLQAIKRNNAQYSQATMAVDPALWPQWTNQGWCGYSIYGDS